MPDHTPVWETVAEGRLYVLGTELRERAYEALKKWFPKSLLLLETSRMAAWIGSDLGNCCGWLHQVEDNLDELSLDYLMDLRHANDAEFLQRLTRLREGGHPVRWGDILPQIEEGVLGATPDLRPLCFRIPKSLLEPK